MTEVRCPFCGARWAKAEGLSLRVAEGPTKDAGRIEVQCPKGNCRRVSTIVIGKP